MYCASSFAYRQLLGKATEVTVKSRSGCRLTMRIEDLTMKSRMSYSRASQSAIVTESYFSGLLWELEDNLN